MSRRSAVPEACPTLGTNLGLRVSLRSVEQAKLDLRVMCSPGGDVEIELAALLVLARSVGDEDLDHLILDQVGNAAPEVEVVP